MRFLTRCPGFKHKIETVEKMRRSHLGKPHPNPRLLNDGNPKWRGDGVGYHALHDWVRVRLIKPELCQICGLIPPRELSNISGEYRRDITDWQYVCRRCHDKYDGKIVDMSNRKCSLCNSDKTYLHKNGRPDWRHSKINGKLICKKCHHRERRHKII